MVGFPRVPRLNRSRKKKIRGNPREDEEDVANSRQTRSHLLSPFYTKRDALQFSHSNSKKQLAKPVYFQSHC